MIDVYTYISNALESVENVKYYTVVPDQCIYPHIYILAISDNYTQHKSTNSMGTHMRSVNVQIETRSISVIEVEQLRSDVLEALYNYFESIQINPIKGPIYDSQESVFRSIMDVIIRL